MRIFVDADACPVKEEIIQVGTAMSVPVVMVASLSHVITVPVGVEVVMVDNRPEAVDLEIVRRIEPGDVVVTQDYGLAAMALARRSRVIHVRGHYLTDQNIDGLLEKRYQGAKIRRAGGRTKGPAALTKTDRCKFAQALIQLVKTAIDSGSFR